MLLELGRNLTALLPGPRGTSDASGRSRPGSARARPARQRAAPVASRRDSTARRVLRQVVQLETFTRRPEEHLLVAQDRRGRAAADRGSYPSPRSTISIFSGDQRSAELFAAGERGRKRPPLEGRRDLDPEQIEQGRREVDQLTRSRLAAPSARGGGSTAATCSTSWNSESCRNLRVRRTPPRDPK